MQGLKGTELIDCTKANIKESIETVAELCGYGNDIHSFEQELTLACQDIGIEINSFSEFSQIVNKNQEIGLQI